MPAERSRARRARPARRPAVHVVMPGLEVARAVPRSRETVTAFLRRTGWARRDARYGWQFRKGLPTTLQVNGEYVLRKEWRKTRIGAGDEVRFVSYPLGGKRGGKQVLGLVALVALAAFATPLAGGILGAAGISSSATLVGTLTAGQALSGALMLGGSLLINALVAPRPGATNDPNAKVDQIYSVQAQGNAARLGQSLPVWYGRLKAYPDFAAAPWSEFVGNDQYLNVLLSPSMGSMEYEQLLVDDTPFWNSTDGVLSGFTSATVAFYEPGAPVTLFPVNVAQADEVSGQQLPHGAPGAYIGGFIANPSGTLANALAVDFVLPAGCFTIDQDSGQTRSAFVSLTAEYRAVDDAGAPIGGGNWSNLFTITRSYASRSPIRDSVKTAVLAGRYEVRFRRNNDVPADNNGASDVIWAGLRAFVVGNNSFPDVSTIAIRIKATESTQGSYKFGVLGTRKIPVWDPGTSAFVTQATRNPFWAALDVGTNAQYGCGIALSKCDFNTILNAAAAADARGDKFDYIFTNAVSAPEAIDKPLNVARSKHFWLGDTMSVVRDEWRDVPSMLLTDREIVRDSVEIGFTMLGDDDPDAVIVEYIDENTWRPAQVQYPPEMPGEGGFHSVNAETKRIDGIVNRDHAYREAAFFYLQSIYRRETVTIGTEYEGRAITFGQALRVQSELPQNYGQSGAVVAVDTLNLTLSPTPTWTTGEQHYVRLRRPNGKWFGPVKVSPGATDDIAELDETDLAAVEAAQSIVLADVLARADGAEYPSFELGTADNQSKLCMVLGGQANGENQCTLSLVVDDERVHTIDIGDPPILPVPTYPTTPKAPLIVGLNASFTQGVAEPLLAASWFPAAGAFYYRADVSYDDGASWIQVCEGIDNKFTAMVTLAGLTLRVQAVGSMNGPFSSVDLAAPTIEILANTVAVKSLREGIRYQVDQLQTALLDRLNSVDQLMSSIAADVAAMPTNAKHLVRKQLTAVHDNLSASVEQVAEVATSADAAFASFRTTVNASLGMEGATVTETAEALATPAGRLIGTWNVKLDVDGYVAGIQAYNDGTTSAFNIVADQFGVSFPGVNGGDPFPWFVAGEVDGAARIGLNGDLFLDGTVTARMITAEAANFITANITNLTADNISSAYAIKNVVDGISSPVTVTCGIAHNDSFNNVQTSATGVVKQSTFTSLTGRVVFWAMVRTGNVNVSPGGDTQFQILKMKLDAVVKDASGNTLQTVPMRAFDANYMPSDTFKNIGASCGGGATVEVDGDVTVQIVASLNTINLNTTSSQTTFNAIFDGADIVFFEPNGII
jgi:hypothetical protein